MHLKQALVATAFGTAVIASPLDVKPRNVPQKADHYNIINLDDFDLKANNGTLEKRVNWKWCVENVNQFATCANVGFALANTIVGISNAIKMNSDNKDCSYHDGTVDEAQYQIHATGSNCDTTAELETIEGGLRTYFDAHGAAVCDVHCVQQNHGGSYVGYLKIAPKGIDISQVICDDSVSFDDGCGEGGKKDAP